MEPIPKRKVDTKISDYVVGGPNEAVPEVRVKIKLLEKNIILKVSEEKTKIIKKVRETVS